MAGPEDEEVTRVDRWSDTIDDVAEPPEPRLGRYRLGARLGAGAMGVVWSAYDPQLDRFVAIKVVHPELARAPEASARLLREARAMAKLRHPAVVMVHDADEVDGVLFIAMELIDGTTLTAHLIAPDRSWRRLLTMICEAGTGLAAAHAAGLLHRDFKPDNVLVSTAGRVCVADFGLATFSGAHPIRASRREARGEVDLTATGALLGTPAYMSPEQLRGEEADPRSDQFSFCVTAWEAVYGARPFALEHASPGALVAHVDTIAAGPPSPVRSGVPRSVERVLRRGLATRPEDRWLDMPTLLAALARATYRSPRARLATGLAIAIGLVVAAIAAFALTRGRPAADGAGATRLFELPMQAAVALSPDGTRVVVGDNGIEVRELDGPRHWNLATSRRVTSVQVIGDTVLYAMRDPDERLAWQYETTKPPALQQRDTDQIWLGSTVLGELYLASDRQRFELRAGERVVQTWTAPVRIAQVALSPSRKKMAYIEDRRAAGTPVVRDLETQEVIAGAPVVELTALAWRDEHTLLLAASDTSGAALFQVELGEHFGEPHLVLRPAIPAVTRLLSAGDAVYAIGIDPTPRGRMIQMASKLSNDLEPSTATVPLAWLDDRTFYVWNRRAGRVDLRDATSVLASTAMELTAEPVNATLTPSRLIVTVRATGGRIALGFPRDGHGEPWRLPEIHAVRCALDRAPPCFVARTIGDRERISPLDPETGTLTGPPIYEGVVEDFAVGEGGAELAIVGPTALITHLAVAGRTTTTTETGLAALRTIAHMPGGGFVIGGTLHSTTYRLAVLVEGKEAPMTQTENELIALARPSQDGTSVTVLVRRFNSSLYRLRSPLAR